MILTQKIENQKSEEYCLVREVVLHNIDNFRQKIVVINGA